MFALRHHLTRVIDWFAGLVHDTIHCVGWVSVICLTLLYTERTHAAFTVSHPQVKETLHQGAPQQASVAIESNAEMSSVNVQVAVLDATRRIVAKQEFKEKKFKAGSTQTFSARFATATMKAGTYTIAVTIFGPNWTPTFHFEDDLAKFDVIGVTGPAKASTSPGGI